MQLTEQDIYEGDLILVNSQYAYRKQAPLSLFPVNEWQTDVLLQRSAKNLLGELMEEIHGWEEIIAVSGWRSEKEQRLIWEDSMKENGPEFTQKYVARPGHSEHQTGLAIDLGVQQEHIDLIRPDFPYGGIGQKFRERAASYGFIERYPAGKESITGIAHEPWHFRYVGMPHAAVMLKNKQTLEEYLQWIRQFSYQRPYDFVYQNRIVQIYYLTLAQATQIETDPAMSFSVSGNNADGFVVTQWNWRQSSAV